MELNGRSVAFINRVHGSAASKSELKYYIIPMRIVMRIMVDAPRGTIITGAAPNNSKCWGPILFGGELFNVEVLLRRSQEVSVAAYRRYDVSYGVSRRVDEVLTASGFQHLLLSYCVQENCQYLKFKGIFALS